MPISRVSLPSGGKGYQWGSHGAKYATKAAAQRQAAAAHAHGYTENDRIKGAGVAFVGPDGRVLFLKRSDAGDHASEWCFPGGTSSKGEEAMDTARREAYEETGQGVEDNTMRLLDRQISDDGVDFTTYGQQVKKHFEPKLNDEHTEHVWATPDNPPTPLHPGVERMLSRLATDTTVRVAADSIAFDRDDTVRTIDQDGRLHVKISHISKANVCPYLGKEIPGAEELGLDLDAKYMLLRDPDELEKAAPTFNNLPILSEHVPVSADDPQKEIIVGSTGTDCVFDEPYLDNSLVFWDGDAIDDIDDERKVELSSAYHYVADMTPGTYDGAHYDGVMREIRGNHVALVAAGRAGSDVVVGDAQFERSTIIHDPAQENNMAKAKPRYLTRKAVLTAGALLAYLRPRMAADAALDLPITLATVTSANWKERKPKIIEALNEAVKTKKLILAKDADIGGLTKLLDALDDEVPVESPMVDDAADLPVEGAKPVDRTMVEDGAVEEICALIRGKVDDATYAAVEEKLNAMEDGGGESDADLDADAGTGEDEETAEERKRREAGGAMDDPPDFPGKPVPPDRKAMDAAIKRATRGLVGQQAMDAALKVATKLAEDSTIKRLRAVADAEKAVRPYVGELAIACDTAEGVYKAALEALGVDLTDVHPSAYRSILTAQPHVSAQQPRRVAADAATQSEEFVKRYGADSTRLN